MGLEVPLLIGHPHHGGEKKNMEYAIQEGLIRVKDKFECSHMLEQTFQDWLRMMCEI